MSWFKNTFVNLVRVDHFMWIHAKISIMVLGVMVYRNPSSRLEDQLNLGLVKALALFIIVGAFLSAVGMIVSLAQTWKHHHRGLMLEFFGLTILTAGALSYLIGVSSVISDGSRLVGFGFVYAFTALLAARLYTIYRRLLGRRSDA